MPAPTQVRRPWRATARTAFAFVISLAALLPFIVDATGLEPEVYPWLAGILAVAAAVTRIMALPQVEEFLARFAPFLAADPAPARHRGDAGQATIGAMVAAVVIGGLLLWLLIQVLELLTLRA